MRAGQRATEEQRTSNEPEQQGTIDEVLPKSMFHVRMKDGRMVRAAIDAEARHGIVRLLQGDTVLVRVFPTDPKRGRITKKLERAKP